MPLRDNIALAVGVDPAFFAAPPPVAAFSGTPLSGDATLAVAFTDESTGSPTSWLWDFGDGGTETSQNPTYYYLTPGTYTVSLTATNAVGSDTETKVGYVTAADPLALPDGVTLAAASVAHPSACWQDAARTVPCGDGDPVAKWDDLTGNGNHLDFGTGSLRPVLRRTETGLWCLSADGVDDRGAVAFTLAQPYTRAAAVRYRDPARVALQVPLDGYTEGTAYQYRRPHPDETTIRTYGGSANVDSSAVAGLTDRTVTVFDGASFAVYRDGTQVASGNAGAAAAGGLTAFRLAGGDYPAAADLFRLAVLPAAADATQRAALKTWLDLATPPEYPTPAYTALDGDGLLLAGTTVGLTLSATAPTKYGSNPVLDPLPFTGPQAQKVWLKALPDGAGGVRLWCGTADAGADYPGLGWTYQTSPDCVTWTKPNLGQVSVSGDTNNNFVYGIREFFTGIGYDPDAPADRRYLACTEAWDNGAGGSSIGVRIYVSGDGEAFTRSKVLNAATGYGMDGEYGIEGGCPVRLRSGKWAFFGLAHENPGALRSIRRYTASEEDPRYGFNPVAYQESPFVPTVNTRQYYRLVVHEVRGGWLGLLSVFNETTQVLRIEPWATADEGATWTQLADSTWLPLGAGGSWESVTHLSATMVTLGDGTHCYLYTGGDGDHATADRHSQVGLATVPAGKLVALTGTGTHTTPAGATAGHAVRADADGTGGSVTAAVLDSGGSVISGYDDADMTAITTDVTDHLISWGGNATLPDGADKVRFTVTTATLHGWRVQ